MAERIGLSKNIKLEWMNLAADQHLAGKTQIEAVPVIDEKIRESVTCQANVRTIRAVLMNMWFKNQDWFLERASEVIRVASSNERIAIHWAMLLKRYPVFYDLCTVIGGLFQYREEITLAQIKNRIFEKWGARDTLQSCLSKNIQMLKELRALNAIKPVGTYTHNTMIISDVHVIQLLCYSIICATGKACITWEDILHHPALFAFKIQNVTQGDMAACEKLILERMGDDVVIRAND